MSSSGRKVAAVVCILGFAVLVTLGVLLRQQSSKSSVANPGAKPMNSADNRSDTTPQPAPKSAGWPQWGGALNSADYSGASFFNRDAARAFRESVAANQRKFVVDLNSRALLPAVDDSTADAASQLFSADALKAPTVTRLLYMQFTEHPTDAQRAQLAQAGVELVAYVDGYAWTARGSAADLLAAVDLPFVRALAQIDPRDKTSAQILSQQTPAHALTPDGLTRFSVLALPGTTLNEIQDQFAASAQTAGLQAASGNASVLGPRFNVVARADQALAIASARSVSFLEYIAPPMANRDSTTDSSSNITLVRDQGDKVDGTGITVAVREVGKPEAHVDYISRTTFVDSNGDSANAGNYTHATAVVGQVASSGLNQPTAKGVAPNVKVLVYALTGDTFQTTDVADAATKGARVSNHSYGPIVSNWGDYQTPSADWDAAIRANNLVAFFAGNEESDAAVNKHIDFFVGMKNGLCIEATSAAANAGNPFASPPVAPSGGSASFAKYGPMNDGRIKPDLVAFGDNVTLDIGTNSITQNTGTSFSTPAATGVAALVSQRYKTVYGAEPSAPLLKAILCETATDLGLPGPDNVYGFGIVNADAAVRLVDIHQASPSTIVFFENTLTNTGAQTYLVTVPASTPSIKTTLCWMDVAGTPGAAKALVNDLDMLLIDPNGGQHFPYSLSASAPSAAATNTGPNTVDPIEQTVVANPIAGTWTIKITGTSIPSGSQAFALCTSVSQSASLNASASASPTNGFAPLAVMFSGQASTGPIVSYAWNFGDGTFGSGATVMHTYAAGSYTAFLTIKDALGNSSVSSGIQIVATTSVIKAMAVAAPTVGDGPLDVHFSSVGSGGNIVKYTWNFGDGSTGDGIQVDHVYAIGTYNATLTVTDAKGNSDTLNPAIVVNATKPAPTDIYALGVKAKVSFSKASANLMQISMIVPELVLTPQQARDAVRNGTYEGKSFSVSAGTSGAALTDLYPSSFLLDRHASQVNRTESFKINFQTGTISMAFKSTPKRDLGALYKSLGITPQTSLLTNIKMRVKVETSNVQYGADYNLIYSGKNGTGTISSGTN